MTVVMAGPPAARRHSGPQEERVLDAPIRTLMDEHRLIERVLGSLETFAFEAGSGLDFERRVAADFGRFFREFADAFHHGKEEDLLFARMVERGFSREAGPVAVMLHEHVEGRARVAVLRRVGEGRGPVEAAERAALVTAAGEFVPLLRAHILKEDRVLYPMALRVLLPDEVAAMQEEFEAYDAQRAAAGAVDALHALADRLGAEFAPDPARMAAAAALAGCGSR
jgi:hemerythrin-like domain-containing protein